jgi:hypothetical protein
VLRYESGQQPSRGLSADEINLELAGYSEDRNRIGRLNQNNIFDNQKESEVERPKVIMLNKVVLIGYIYDVGETCR